MRYVSVASTRLEVPSERRRFGLLPVSKWRRPARERMTLPVAVILKRLATDFFVLIPLGRRIVLFRKKRARNIGAHPPRCKWKHKEFHVSCKHFQIFRSTGSLK